MFAARRYQSIGGGWYSARYAVGGIAEPGGSPLFLIRGHLPFFRHDVADNLMDLHYIGDDCVVYTLNTKREGELYAACGDRAPILLDRVEKYQKISIEGDSLRVHDKMVNVAEAKRRAGGIQ